MKESTALPPSDLYSIRTDIVCNYYEGHLDNEIRTVLGDFLQWKNKWRTTSELFTEFISRQSDSARIKLLSNLPDREKWENDNYLTGPCAKEMVRYMKEWPDIIHDGPFNWNEYHFGAEDFANPVSGVILNQSVEVDPIKDRSYFKILFAYVFQKVEHPENFLQYHFNQTFDRKPITYRQLLNDCFDILITRKRFIKQWIKDELENTKEGIEIKDQSYTQKQVALMVFYKQAAGSIDPFEDGEKTKKLKEIAEFYGPRSINTLMDEYNSVSSVGASEYRLKILKNPKNQAVLKEILKNDSRALIELNIEINKLGNPLP